MVPHRSFTRFIDSITDQYSFQMKGESDDHDTWMPRLRFT